MTLQEMIASHPDVDGSTNAPLIRAIEEMARCALHCTSCADACIAEEMTGMTQCIRMCLDCADICDTTAHLATRRAGSNEAILRQALLLCADMCRDCAAECARHAGDHQHCRQCEEACRTCADACRAAADSIRA
jgi:hypothetical protein